MSEIPYTQTRLSEVLLLLQQFGYRDPTPINRRSVGILGNKVIRQPQTNADLRILDLVATCLTTGKPGDVVAAAFDKREQISLVLAKTGEVLPEDRAATRTFLSALATAQTWIDVLPFLIKHGKANMDKRIRKLHECLVDLCSDLQSEATSYSFQSMDEEFPGLSILTDPNRKAKYGDGQTVSCVLRDLVKICTDESTFEVQLDDTKTLATDQPSIVQYMFLYIPANALRKSRFLRKFTSDHDDCGLLQTELRERVERLKRRLDKICQYDRIGMLIKVVRRFPNIPIRWVEDPLIGMGKELVDLEVCANPMDVVKRELRRDALPSVIMEEMDERFPDLTTNWNLQRNVHPCIHPELRIILHLSPLLPELAPGTELPIGCSKRTCLCCGLWIDAFKTGAALSWVTSGSNGKAYKNWVLPHAAGQLEGISWRLLDNRVIEGVSTRLLETLSWVTKLLWQRHSYSTSPEAVRFLESIFATDS